MDIKELFLLYFASQEAAYFGTVLQAITAAGAAVYGLFSFNNWMKQKYLEKCSDYAEASLNYLDSAHEMLMDAFDDPHQMHEKSYSKIKSEFGQAYRKARRLGDATINMHFKNYQQALLSMESDHKVKKVANDQLKEELPKLYVTLYEELVEHSLIRHY